VGALILAAYLAIIPTAEASTIPHIQKETAKIKAKAQHDRAMALAEELDRERMERAAERDLAAAMAADPEPSAVYHTGSTLCDSSCIECESGWNPQAWSPTGKYWGLYQFDYSTWVAHGGSGEQFGKADAATQHEIASRITYDAWPNC
jgi:hypothetical protein